MKKQIAVVILLATAASSVLTAGSVESSAPAPTPEDPWSFTLTPYRWMTSIDGDYVVSPIFFPGGRHWEAGGPS